MVYEIVERLFSYEVNWFVPLIYLPVLLWFAIRAHNSSEVEGSTTKTRATIMVYSVLNAIVALVWILIYGEHHLNHDSSWFQIFDTGAPIGTFLLLIVIPVGLIGKWWPGKKGFSLSRKESSYIFASWLFYLISAVPPFYLILFFTGMALAN